MSKDKKRNDVIQSSNISSELSKSSNNRNNHTNKLTLSKINKLANKFNERRKVYIEVEGEKFEVAVNTIFSRSEVEDACLESLEIFGRAMQIEGINVNNLMKNMENFLQVCILKKFTNLPIPDLDNIAKFVKLTKNLYDLGILSKFFGEEKVIGEENIKLISEVFDKVAIQIGQVLGSKALVSELRKNEGERIDVDDYFAELEMRNFDIAVDEDLTLLQKVIDQLNEDGLYEEYMSKLTPDEVEKLKLRLELLQERNHGDGEKS